MHAALVLSRPVMFLGMIGGLYRGLPYIPELYAAHGKGFIGTGKTASEAINNCLIKIYEKKSLHPQA